MPLSVYDVVKAISQATHNKHDGALDENGEPVVIGLKREEQPLIDRCVMDGFNVVMHGNMLILKYHSYEPLRNLHEKKFEKEVERRIEEVRSYIAKEFSKITGSNLRLKPLEDVKVLVETGNRIKVMVKAMMAYEILNLKGAVEVVAGPSTIAKDNQARMDAYYEAQRKLVKKAKPINITRPKAK
jgi:hypothetical protein